ncbi:MAG: hypothetical protein IT454_08040 [Planctomycetes bacterium]|nr:hypothetical protein [Planctomycetota bacterium]
MDRPRTSRRGPLGALAALVVVGIALVAWRSRAPLGAPGGDAQPSPLVAEPDAARAFAPPSNAATPLSAPRASVPDPSGPSVVHAPLPERVELLERNREPETPEPHARVTVVVDLDAAPRDRLAARVQVVADSLPAALDEHAARAVLAVPDPQRIGRFVADVTELFLDERAMPSSLHAIAGTDEKCVATASTPVGITPEGMRAHRALELKLAIDLWCPVSVRGRVVCEDSGARCTISVTCDRRASSAESGWNDAGEPQFETVSVEAGDGGDFELQLRGDGRCTAVFEAPGHVASVLAFRLDESGVTRLGTVTLERGVAARGVVRVNRRPASELSVSFAPVESSPQRARAELGSLRVLDDGAGATRVAVAATTAADGSFEVRELRRGRYRVRVEAPGQPWIEFPERIVDVPSEALAIELEADEIQLAMVDANGAEVSGPASVLLEVRPAGQGREPLRLFWHTDGSTRLYAHPGTSFTVHSGADILEIAPASGAGLRRYRAPWSATLGYCDW